MWAAAGLWLRLDGKQDRVYATNARILRAAKKHKMLIALRAPAPLHSDCKAEEIMITGMEVIIMRSVSFYRSVDRVSSAASDKRKARA